MKTLCSIFIACLFTLSSVKAQSSLPVSSQQFRDQFMTAINAKRAEGCNCGTSYMRPVPALFWNDQLAKAATQHANDMARNYYFSHDSEDGRDLQDRLISAGYSYRGFQSYAIGENIAYNQRSIDEVLDGWFKSPEHCKNLMNPQFTEIGIAENNYFWVQDFGGRVRFAFR